jgi:hypothetical protein
MDEETHTPPDQNDTNLTFDEIEAYLIFQEEAKGNPNAVRDGKAQSKLARNQLIRELVNGKDELAAEPDNSASESSELTYTIPGGAVRREMEFRDSPIDVKCEEDGMWRNLPTLRIYCRKYAGQVFSGVPYTTGYSYVVNHKSPIPPPPCTLLLVDSETGRKMGWAFISALPPGMVERVRETFIKMILLKEQVAWPPEFTDREIFGLRALSGLRELAKRFMLNPFVPGETSEDHYQMFNILGAVQMQSEVDGTWKWYIEDKYARASKYFFSIGPAIADSKSNKHCMNSLQMNCKLVEPCPRGCKAAGCVGNTCFGTFPRLWCEKCDVGCWCSKECKRENKREHASMCAFFQETRAYMKFQRMCHHCGTPEFTEGVKLKMCGRCKQTTYCSSACQQLDWKGHKIACEKYL